MDYKQAGVDVDAADALVERIRPITDATKRPGTMGGIGGFGALFDPKAAGFVNPILVSTADGVGTKLLLAIKTGLIDDIGIDLVAMCVNDLIVHGAEPLYMLDYFATGKLDPEVVIRVIQGIARGCKMARCALVGGEMAEMPGMYRPGDLDLAGFAVGAVEHWRVLPADVRPGDILIGLPSSGLHSNGFSLVRRILDIPGEEIEATLAKQLLTPTLIYTTPVLALHKLRLLKAAAHITGGGLIDNLPRVLPTGVRAIVKMPWHVPAIFGRLQRAGEIETAEMLRTFNCGIGMVLVVSPKSFSTAMETLAITGSLPVLLGCLAEGDEHEIELPSETWWG